MYACVCMRCCVVVIIVVVAVLNEWTTCCTQDTVATTRKLNEYKDADYQFADSRECKLIEVRSRSVGTQCRVPRPRRHACACRVALHVEQSVLGAYEGGDVDAFVEALSEYDRISKLDPWRIAYVVLLSSCLCCHSSLLCPESLRFSCKPTFLKGPTANCFWLLLLVVVLWFVWTGYS